MRKCDFCKKNGICSIAETSEYAVRDWFFFEPENGWGSNQGYGVAPRVCGTRYDHNKFFGCPRCGTKVGGYIITGGGENDWGRIQISFVTSAGRK